MLEAVQVQTGRERLLLIRMSCRSLAGCAEGKASDSSERTPPVWDVIIMQSGLRGYSESKCEGLVTGVPIADFFFSN